MSLPQTLLEEEQSLEIFKEMLLSTLNIKEPIVQLKDIPQWVGFLKSVGVKNTPLDDCSTFLSNGYFYNFSSRTPINKLDINHEAEIHFIPTLRDECNASILETQGFIKIPSYIESCLEIVDSLDFQLKHSLGNKRYKDIKRLTNKGRKCYPIIFYDWQDIQGNNCLLNAFAKLHEYNSFKYNHNYNLYNYDALKKLFESHLKKNIFIGLRYDKENSRYVQGFIFLVGQKYSDIYLLAQGSNIDMIQNGNNLYVAMLYELFNFAYSRKIFSIYLGRGSELNKRKIGANKFFLLNNWIKPINKNLIFSIHKIQLCSKRIKENFNALKI